VEVALEPGAVDDEQRVVGHGEADAVAESAEGRAAPKQQPPPLDHGHAGWPGGAWRPDARQEESEQDEARDGTQAEEQERRAPSVAPDEQTDERDADERAARPRKLDEPDREAAGNLVAGRRIELGQRLRVPVLRARMVEELLGPAGARIKVVLDDDVRLVGGVEFMVEIMIDAKRIVV